MRLVSMVSPVPLLLRLLHCIVIGLKRIEILADPPEPKQLTAGLFGQQRQLLSENPTSPIIIPEVEPPIHELRSPSQPLRAVEISAFDGGEQLTTRDFPTVGGMGRMPGPLKTRNIKSKVEGEPPRQVTVDTTLPRIGGKGEYGVRGTPFFPTVPERMQTSTTQEMFRPVGEMLERMAEPPPPRTQHRFVDIEQPPTVERFPGIPDDIRRIQEQALANVDEFGRTKLPPQPEIKGQTLGQRARARKRAGIEDWQVEEYKPGDMIDVEVLNPNRPGGPAGPQGPIQDITPTKKPVAEKAAASKIPEIRKAGQQILVERANAKKKGAARQVYDYAATSGWTIMEQAGEAGKQASRWMQRTRGIGAGKAGTLTDKYRSAIDAVKDKDFEQVVDVVEGNATSDNPQINAAADAVRNALDEAGRYAEESGTLMADKSGELTPFQRMKENYFPHKFEPGTFNEESIVNKLMQEKGMSYKEAKFVFDNGVKKGPRLLSPQHERSMDLSGYKKTKQAFYEHIDDLINRAEETREFGPRDEKLLALAEKTNNPEQVASIMNEQLGRTSKDPAAQTFANTVNTIEATAKLPLFAISQMNQGAAIGLRSSGKAFVKGLYDTVRKGNVKSAETTGAIQTVARSTFQETGQNWLTKGMSKALGWQKSEEFLRSWSANTGKYEAETLFNKLKKNPGDKTARAKLDNLLLEDIDTVIKQDALTPEQQKLAGFRMSELTQGLVDPADLPPLWSAHPLVKIPLLFKRYAFQQSRIIKNAWHENQTPKDKAIMGAKLFTLYTLMGEATTDVKDVIKGAAAGKTGDEIIDDFLERGGRPEDAWTNKPVMDRVISNIADGYAFGIVGQILGAATMDRPGALPDFFIGPAAGDIFDLVEAGNRNKEALGREVVSKVLPLGYAFAENPAVQKALHITAPPRKRGKPRKKSMLPSMPKVTGVAF